uniref:Cytochrome P450 n=1 Tax=Psilocybe cubensis TaxID=181762 RepID=A0A8H8CE67_PSICU
MSTDEPGHVKAILSSQFESFEKGPMLYSQLESFFGTGVFNADGEMWKSVSLQLFLNETMFTPIIRFHRAMTRPFFTKDRISHFDLFARTCDMSLATAKNRLSEGYSIDIQDLVSRFTLDSSTEFLFGGSVGSILGGLPYPPSSSRENPPEFYNHPSTTFVDAFTKGMGYTALRLIRGNQWPLSEFWKDVVAPLREIMDQFTEPLMQAALNKRGT